MDKLYLYHIAIFDNEAKKNNELLKSRIKNHTAFRRTYRIGLSIVIGTIY